MEVNCREKLQHALRISSSRHKTLKCRGVACAISVVYFQREIVSSAKRESLCCAASMRNRGTPYQQVVSGYENNDINFVSDERKLVKVLRRFFSFLLQHQRPG